MDFYEGLNTLAAKVQQQRGSIATEEATKTAFIMPFIKAVLGYDVFDPHEVVPEYVCDIGTKKGEKIDYAILKDGQVQILIECKKVGEPLNLNHASQLFRYFHVTTARISILTNGQVYKFYTDLDSPNKMDEKPFLEIDLLDIDEYAVPEIKKLTKSAFDVDSVLSAAGELKYIGEMKREIARQMTAPDDEFTLHFIKRVYDGAVTAKVKEQFTPLLNKAIAQYTADLVNDRLKSAITGIQPPAVTAPAKNTAPETAAECNDDESSRIVTSAEELEGFFIVKSIVRTIVTPERIHHRDTISYFGILLDDNNRKPICRLHFNRAQKYVGIMDADKKETRHPIQKLDDIYNLSELLIEATQRVV